MELELQTLVSCRGIKASVLNCGAISQLQLSFNKSQISDLRLATLMCAESNPD